MTNSDDFSLYYTPCSSENEAKTLAEALLKNKLIACANILPKIQSLYRWEGKIQLDQEALLILKTTDNRTPKIQEYFSTHHSYETFCLIRIKTDFINAEYLQWVKEQVSD